MFGYVTINQGALSEEEFKRYRGFYCGLCHTLKEAYGNVGRLTLSYDLTFLKMVLSGLYELDETTFTQRCPVHPAQKQLFVTNEVSRYCADMNILLSYYKALDDWKDDRSLRAKALLKQLKTPFEQIERAYPEKCRVVQECLQMTQTVEESNRSALDELCNLTGRMLGEVYAWKNDHWEPELRRMGEALGRFIYLMDAYDDLKDDEKKGRYNPLLAYRHQTDFESLVKEGLTLMISECADAFEALPVLQDARIMRNVLYTGVWSRYGLLQKKEKKELTNGR
ncbi:MAG: hypothetical protein IJF65_07850 [Clostridia bacterium]|nr:hypothetical protein [Clostridia bacterium]